MANLLSGVSVSKVGGKFRTTGVADGSGGISPPIFTDGPRCVPLDPDSDPRASAEAERIFQALRQAAEDEHWRIAQLLASKADGQILGATEFEVRDLVHEIGAKAIQAALEGRKKGGTRGPA